MKPLCIIPYQMIPENSRELFSFSCLPENSQNLFQLITRFSEILQKFARILGNSRNLILRFLGNSGQFSRMSSIIDE